MKEFAAFEYFDVGKLIDLGITSQNSEWVDQQHEESNHPGVLCSCLPR
jgi:hypothetical protein